MSVDDEKISRLYQQGEQVNPPEQLDQLILKAASDAVIDGGRKDNSEDDADLSQQPARVSSIKSPFSGGWPATLSIAAVVVISVILIPMVELQSPSESMPEYVSKSMPGPTSETQPEPTLLSEPENKGMFFQQGKNQAVVGAKSEARVLKKRSMKIVSSDSSLPMASGTLRQVSDQAVHMDAEAESSRVQPMSVGIKKMSYTNEADIAEQNITEKQMMIADSTHWLNRIKQLFIDDEIAQARQELKNFKNVYPDEKFDKETLELFNQKMSQEKR